MRCRRQHDRDLPLLQLDLELLHELLDDPLHHLGRQRVEAHEATIDNARALLKLQQRTILAAFLWGLIDGRPDQRAPLVQDHPAETPTSKAISKALKAEGFRFVGPTTMYAFMQATGMVNDHLVTCHRYEPCAELQRRFKLPPTAPGSASEHDRQGDTRSDAAGRTQRAWQRMLSGRRLDLLDPSPRDIEIEDIAHGLARVARWNGQTVGEHAFSVAQHALLVEEIATALHPTSRGAGSWRRCCTMRPNT